MRPAVDLAPGFAEPVHGAQQTFRDLLNALACPGAPVETVGVDAAPAPLSPTLAAAALTLLDHETRVALCPPLDRAGVPDYLAFHTGADLGAALGEADFVLAVADALPDIAALKVGTAEYPDRSATLLIGVDGFGGGERVTLSGPGIEETRDFAVDGLDAAFWAAARRNHARYPLGVDFIFCGPGAVAGLPRSAAIAARASGAG